MDAEDIRRDAALRRLQDALVEQRTQLAPYEQPSEPVVFETLRAFDDLYCRDLMLPSWEPSKNERHFRTISTWGVNHALRRILPRVPSSGPFRYFPSRTGIQDQVDDFIFGCGTLELAERYEGWFRDGLLTGELRRHSKGRGEVFEVLLLRTAVDSFFDEEIGIAGLRWAGSMVSERDAPCERGLEHRHEELRPALEQHVTLLGDWLISYTATREIDDYFLEWARLYLRRIFSQDMLAPDDIVGGRPFSRYVDVLTALSGRSQKHLAYAAILMGRYPQVHIRNMLTVPADRETFIESLAAYMDADRVEIEAILASFILNGENVESHTRGGEAAWAPIVQASGEALILPIFGLDINPFRFLFNDLRLRFEKDWFRAANNREGRWIDELTALLSGPRWRVNAKNQRLTADGRTVTDIDFSAFQTETNELALFQLKWQQPVGLDSRARRSAGKNLIDEGNRWVDAVSSWIERHGTEELARRLGFRCASAPSVQLFVLGRYHLHLGGFDNRDAKAVWSDWAHFQRASLEEPSATVSQLAASLRSRIEQVRAMKTGESNAVPVGNLSIVLNPKSAPDRID